MERGLSDRYRQALEAAAELSGGWLCIREFDPAAHTALRIAAGSAARIHYAPWCRLCHRYRENAACLRDHGEHLRQTCLAERGTVSVTCWAGVTEQAVPLFAGETLAAVILLGGGRKGPFSALPDRVAGILRSLAPQGEAEAAYEALPVWDEGRMRAVGALLEAALEAAEEDAALVQEDAGPEAERLGAPAVRYYVYEHLSEPTLNVSSAAAVLGVSREHLSRRFRSETGVTLRDYIRAERMDRARLLLRNSDRPVSEIAEQCGYSDAGHFARLFRLETGSSPGAWRRDQKGK